MANTTEVIIIGGGITGTAAAYELARSGVTVTLVEQASLANMGSGRTLAGVRQSGRHPAELPLAVAAVERWGGLGEELGADLEYRQDGNLRLAEDEGDVPGIEEMVGRHRDLGLEIRFLEDNSAVREITPSLAGHIQAASFTPTDGHANPMATVRAFAAAARRAGARILEDTSVIEINVQDGRVTGVATNQGAFPADRVVLAAGIDTPRLLGSLGEQLPISLAMVPVIQTVPAPPLLRPVLGTAKAHFAARQEVGGRMRFSSGGQKIDLTPEQVTRDLMQPDLARTAETLSRGISIIPEIAGLRVNTVWGGLIDLTPDGLPVIDFVREVDGLIVAAGFSGHGFCLGPVSGEIIRDLIEHRPYSHDLTPFRWARFAAQNDSDCAELLG